MRWYPARDGVEPGGEVEVNVASRESLLADLSACLAAGRGFGVATLNLDHVVKLRRDAAFRAAYRAMTHVTADGRPIVALSRLAGRPVDLVAGSDLLDPVMALAARAGVPVAFFGSREATLEVAAARLSERHPGLDVVLRLAPSGAFDPAGPEADAAIARIGASGARLCCVALGAPKQEVFAMRARTRLPATGFLSIGASLDFVAGDQVRAPALMRRLWLEWLWRMGTDPVRLAPRYARCALALPGLVLAALRARAGR